MHKAASDYSDARGLFLHLLQQQLEQLSNTKLKRQLQITYHVSTTTVAQIIQIYSNGHAVPICLVPQILTNILEFSQQTVVGMLLGSIWSICKPMSGV